MKNDGRGEESREAGERPALDYESPQPWTPTTGQSLLVMFLLCLLPFAVVVGMGILVVVLLRLW